MADRLVDDLIVAVDSTAATFDGRGWQVKERWLEMMIEGTLRAGRAVPLRQVRLRLGQTWQGNVGGVDLGLRAEDGSLALMELKWDRRTLAACAWDAIKLAAALHEGQGDRAFLIAGSPVGPTPLRGHELLGSGTFDALRLYEKYAAEFARWRRDVQNRPLQVPASWRLRALHSAPLVRREQSWEIRIAELTEPSEELVPLA